MSESTGKNLVLFFNSVLIKFIHKYKPLFTIAIFFVNLIDLIVGTKPSIPVSSSLNNLVFLLYYLNR